jgi:hypothetical protein
MGSLVYHPAVVAVINPESGDFAVNAVVTAAASPAGLIACWVQDKSPTRSSTSVVRSSTLATQAMIPNETYEDAAVTGILFPRTRSGTLSLVCDVESGTAATMSVYGALTATSLNSATTPGPLHQRLDGPPRNKFSHQLKRDRVELGTESGR